MTWDPEHVDIDSAPFITDYNNFRERTESGTVTRDKLVSGSARVFWPAATWCCASRERCSMTPASLRPTAT
ncbi:hypothetical protein M8494_08860 [Serratia ureilytica]